MKAAYVSLPRRTRIEMMLSLVLAAGIIVAFVLPAPRRMISAQPGERSLVALMEGDYINPLFSTPNAISVLNGATRQFARFSGYDEYFSRVELWKSQRIVKITRYTGDIFSLLGIDFRDKDSTSEGPRIFISEALWERAFDRNPAVIGSIVTLHGRQYTIAGTTSRFGGFLDDTDIWLPVCSRGASASVGSMKIIGALHPGVSWRKAQGSLTKVFRSALQDHAYTTAHGTRIVPLEKGFSFGSDAMTLAHAAHGQTLALF